MNKKKIAAATAAVFAYIKSQEEAAYYAASEADSYASTFEQSNRFSAWANAGRLSQMAQNTAMLMQLR